MRGELFINGIDAYTHGVSMGDGFLSAIKSPLPFKEDIENNSAIEHGRRFVLSTYLDSREVSLTFTVQGENTTVFAANRDWFLSELYSRKLVIKIKGDDNYYRFVYSGKNTSYGYSPSGVFCIIAAKFIEVNPHDRGEVSENNLFQSSGVK